MDNEQDQGQLNTDFEMTMKGIPDGKMLDSPNVFYTSRSAIERFQHCPRARYWEYCYEGRGIVPAKFNLDMATGSAVHEGLAVLLARLKQSGKLPEPHIVDDWVDGAVMDGLAWYQQRLASTGMLESDDEIWQYQIQEHLALTEALIRVFGIWQLPRFAARYKVLAVEREETYQLAPGIVLQGKVDAIVLELATNSINLISFKTAKSFDERTEKSAQHDNQGISETLVAESRLQSDNHRLRTLIDGMDSRLAEFDTPEWMQAPFNKAQEEAGKLLWPSEQVNVVHMVWLLKGDKREDTTWQEGTQYIYGSPLIRGYHKWNEVKGIEGNGFWEYAWNYTPPSSTTKSGKGRLGKGWERFDAWSEFEGGIKAWLELLMNTTEDGVLAMQPECGPCLPEQFVEREFTRHQREIDSWVRQVREQEINVAEMASCANADMDARDTDFPQYRRGCHYPTDCPYTVVCFDSEVEEAPMLAKDQYGDNLFKWRTPHHAPELEQHNRLYRIKDPGEESGDE
jgi:hypothetical protein